MNVVPVLGSPICRKTLASAAGCAANSLPSRIVRHDAGTGLTRQDVLPWRSAGWISTQAIVGEGASNAVRDDLRANLHTADKPPMLRNVLRDRCLPVPLPRHAFPQ